MYRFEIQKESRSCDVHQWDSSNKSSDRSLNSFSMIKLNLRVALISDKIWCQIWCSGHSPSNWCTVIARSGCSLDVWQAISSWEKCRTEICVVSCLAIYGISRSGRARTILKTSWISCWVENTCFECKVLDICTAISSGTLTGRSTQRARSAV